MAQLVGARSVGAADSALAGLRGGLGDVIEAIRMDALTLLADIEVSRSRVWGGFFESEMLDKWTCGVRCCARTRSCVQPSGQGACR